MPVNDNLMQILACPETKQPVSLATAEQLEVVNAKIRAGNVLNRGGDLVSEELGEALIREDGHVLYPVRNNIPIMLIGESIEL